MATWPRVGKANPIDVGQPYDRSWLNYRARNEPRRTKARGLMLTSVLAVLVWLGYNSEIDIVLNPQFPTDFLSLIHGIRAFFPMLAAVIASGILARRRSLPKWLGFSPLSLL